ncbi:copper homeostasis protein CutC [[Clostridium] dakarense]|uniref:copper homeostasis protein CutC n=1 Tax=Faecalimicrobium dakarense TaxID=1301100 RepID=UPI0004B57000|nr:copper homeostasis protein CutC [[Clostridium] dakarense]
MLEIIGMTVEDAKMIEYCGADRIELVSALTEGGVTPSFGLIEAVVNSVEIPVNIMIRHHANSFVYSNEDINIMLKDIDIVKNIGANGVVLGLLDNYNNIDENNLKLLLRECGNLDVTFHKAIDDTDCIKSIDTLNNHSQITNILTSGGKGNILNNIDIIKEMIYKSNNINILLGGGLNFNNINEIKEKTNAKDYHFGTAVRVDKNPFGKIDEVKLKELVKIIKI